MERAAIKLILSDIDSTILPCGASRVSDRTIAAFHAALDAGIAVGPASGRGFAQLAPFFAGDTACFSTAVATNGLEVYHEGARICAQTLPHEALVKVLEVLRTIPRAGLICFDGAQPLLVTGDRADLARHMPAYAATCEEVDGLPEFPVIKANAFMAGDALTSEEFCARVSEAVPDLDFDIPLPGYLNMMPKGWNKGSAVRYLCDHLGIGLDEVVVFGDAANDLTMFDVVENAAAVANATPDAATAARWHIGACADDAVAHAIEQLAAGEWPFAC